MPESLAMSLVCTLVNQTALGVTEIETLEHKPVYQVLMKLGSHVVVPKMSNSSLRNRVQKSVLLN